MIFAFTDALPLNVPTVHGSICQSKDASPDTPKVATPLTPTPAPIPNAGTRLILPASVAFESFTFARLAVPLALMDPLLSI